MSTQRYFTLSDGAKLAYDIHGQEHLNNEDTRMLPLILFGGVSSTKDDWGRLLPHLSKTRAVLTFDYRGIGLSTYSTPANDDKISIESMARDVIALIQSFEWPEVDIIAFSMGGVILQQILLLQLHPAKPPFRIRRAVLSATFASPIPPEYHPKPLPKVNSGSLEDQKLDAVRATVEASLGPKWVAAPENQERLKTWLENSLRNRPFQTVMRQRKMLAKFSFVDSLAAITSDTEVLVIHGLDDMVVPFCMAEEILRACPQARLVSIGSKRGQVPTYSFGHLWYEYFDVDVWVGVLDVFFGLSTRLISKI